MIAAEDRLEQICKDVLEQLDIISGQGAVDVQHHELAAARDHAQPRLRHRAIARHAPPDLVGAGRRHRGGLKRDAPAPVRVGQRGAELLNTTAGTLPYAATNRTNAWIQTGQTGWGMGIESLQLADGPFEFNGVYLFDANGQARWLTGTTRETTSGSVQLSSQPTHCPGCPFYADNAALAQPAGTLTRSYSSRTRATLSSSINLPAPLSGTWNRSNVEIQAFGDNNP